MTTQKEVLEVEIFGRQYSVCCSPEERSALHASVGDLNTHFNEFQQKKTLHTRDQLCMLAALNFAYECRQAKAEKKPGNTISSDRITALQEKIAEKLAKDTVFEL